MRLRLLANGLGLTIALNLGAGCNGPELDPPVNVPDPATNTAIVKQTDFQIVSVPTLDGAVLALKRRPNVGAAPVLLIHGLAVNGDAWDLPAVDGPDFSYRSLASVLLDCGYDVWLLNLRGHGTNYMYSQPPAGQKDWSVDHFALYDVPAAVEYVASATGRRPFIVASSMGAMSVAGWLQGATWSPGDAQSEPAAQAREGEAPAEPPREGEAPAEPKPHDEPQRNRNARIVADPIAAAARQSQIAGAVLVAFPAALRWPNSPVGDDGVINWLSVWTGLGHLDADSNFPFELASRSVVLQMLIELTGDVPLRWLRPDERLIALRNRLPRPVGAALETAEERLLLAGANFIGTFNGATHNRAAVILRGKRYIMEDMKAGVLRQLAKSVRARAFVSDLGEPTYIYSEHYANITSPTFLVLGGRDRVANAQTARDVFFDQIASADKSIEVFADLGHGEFEAAPVATEQVYPEIISWIAAREALSESPPVRDSPH